jgi:hypothetical protein
MLLHVSAGFGDLEKCCLWVVAVDFQVNMENRQTESVTFFSLDYLESIKDRDMRNAYEIFNL